MTNEELAMLAKDGDTAAEAALYQQVYRWIYLLASKYFHLCANAGIEEDDMLQECWFGFRKAVQAFDPDRGAFTTHLKFYIKKTCIRDALGIVHGKMKPPPASLDEKAFRNDDSEETLLDLLVDESINVTGGAELTDLQRVVRGAVDRLSERERIVIHGIYYQRQTLNQIGQLLQVGVARVGQIHVKALRKLRNDPAIRAFEPFYVREGSDTYWERLMNARGAVILSPEREQLEQRIDSAVSLYLAWCSDNGIQPQQSRVNDIFIEEVGTHAPPFHP